MRIIQFIFLISMVWACGTVKPVEEVKVTMDDNETTSIKQVLHEQQRSWNKGDLEGFMEGYWHSDSLMFIGSGGVTFGWENTLNNYNKGYPTKEKMGRLEFEVIHLDKVNRDSYFMMGKFTLIRVSDKPTGYFVLLWKLINGQWKIVSDHTVV